MFFKSDGCRSTKFLHSSRSIFPSLSVSASSNASSIIVSRSSSGSLILVSNIIATTICLTCIDKKPRECIIYNIYNNPR
ncbi:hypothetical protein KSP39_PZI016192 [Platanthera zijinensis]|uniref:Uncharacterized protein n=1 Tax=Platanthera zijinensis TaxID=2320716 RepID=A0AAP0B6Q5_9ASPA